MRAVLCLALAVGLAGCGGSSKLSVPGAPEGAEVQSRDAGGGWTLAWATSGERAWATVLRDGDVVEAGKVTVRPLGPDAGETSGSIPQVAAELEAPVDLEDYALLVDGEPLDVRGGGLTGRNISIYGAPASSLSPGRHVVVAFARAGGSAVATAWTFTVR